MAGGFRSVVHVQSNLGKDVSSWFPIGFCFFISSILRFRLTNKTGDGCTCFSCYTPCCFIEISVSPRWAPLTRQCPLQWCGCASRALDGPPWSYGRGTAGRVQRSHPSQKARCGGLEVIARSFYFRNPILGSVNKLASSWDNLLKIC